MRRRSRRFGYGRRGFRRGRSSGIVRRRFRRGRRFGRRRNYGKGIVYKFIRTQTTTLVNSTTAPTPGAITYILDNVPQASEFKALFDRYRIVGVKHTFVPKINQINISGADAGTFHYAVDYTDATAPGSVDDLAQMSTYHHRYCIDPFSIYLKPRMLYPVLGVGTNQGYVTSRSGWIESVYGAVPHYGLRYYWTQGSSAAVSMNVFTKYYLKFRDPK